MRLEAFVLFSLWLLVSCRDAGPLSAPVATYHRDASGALVGAFDADELNEFLTALDLPLPSEPLASIEGGRCEAFVVALDHLDREQSALSYGTVGLFFHSDAHAELADACYRTASELDPNEARWVHYRGDLAERRQDALRATERFAAAAQLAPKVPAPRARLVRLLAAEGRDEELELAANELLTLDPRSLIALTELSAAALDGRQLDRAERLLQRAFDAWPRQRRVLLLLARLYSLTGREAEAERLRAQAVDALELGTLTLDPWMAQLERDTSSVLFWEACAAEYQGARRWQELFEAAGELDRRQDGPVWKAKQAQVLLYMNRPDDARRLANEVALDFPEAPHGLEVLSVVALRAGQPLEARSRAEEALARDPRSRVGHETLVKACLALDLEDEALRTADALKERYADQVEPVLLGLFVRRTLCGAAMSNGRSGEAARHRAAGAALYREGEALAPGDVRLAQAARWLAE